MSVTNFEELKQHIGHKIVCVGYKDKNDKEYQNIAIECEDCFEVLIDFENEKEE